jgi:excisionase family DNA binding protein
MEQQVDPLPLPSLRETLSLRETAGELGCHPDSVRRKLKNGELGFFKIGDGPFARIRISRTDLESYLEKHYVAASAAGKAAKKASHAKSRASGKPRRMQALKK